jgi:hypothetical protein
MKHDNLSTTGMNLLYPLVILMAINTAAGSPISLQICHSHCNIGEVSCILQCPHLMCEQECTRAEERCVQLCDADYTTTQKVITADPSVWNTRTTRRTTPAPTTQETPTPSTMSIITEDVEPTPKPHQRPTIQNNFPVTYTTTEDPSGVVIVG